MARGGYTTDIPIDHKNTHTKNLRTWSAGVLREVDAQEASPETQMAIVGAAIEAVSNLRGSAEPSPHEAAVVKELLGVLSSSRDSPLKQDVLGRIKAATPVKIEEFDQARALLKQTLAPDSPATPRPNLCQSHGQAAGCSPSSK